MPRSSRPMPIGQVIGAHLRPSTRSMSSSSSTGSRPSRSSLLTKVMIGVSRSRQTSISLMVRSSTPFAQSMTISAESTAVSVRYVSSEKSSWPGVSSRFTARPRNGNCMTDEVTEMPRSCSSRIQSEVACRAALRPLTVPAIWIAPPNSSSFSVSVVLPASGWEMIAKVRRRSIAAVRSDSLIGGWAAARGRNGSGLALGAPGGECPVAGSAPGVEIEPVHERVLATADRLVVAVAHADRCKAERLVQQDRRAVRGPHLEEGPAVAGIARLVEQPADQPPAGSEAAQVGAHAHVQDVRLARAHRHDAVAADAVGRRQHAAQVADPQAVAEDADAPREHVRGRFDLDDRAEVRLRHAPVADLR